MEVSENEGGEERFIQYEARPRDAPGKQKRTPDYFL
jgi:hypothetical protein